MLRNYLIHLKATHLRAMREQKGQAIIIFTFAFLALIAMLGLALDLGLVYIEKVKVSRTADAAALAAVVELPFEEEAINRAIEYIELNGYDVGVDTEVLVRGCIDTDPTTLPFDGANVDAGIPQPGPGLNPAAAVPITPTTSITGWLYRPTVNPARATFVIDTLAYQPVDLNPNGTIKTTNNQNCLGDPSPLYGISNKLRVSGRVNVDMNFMQFFGFSEVPVEDRAVGENVSNLDVAVVFDVSGSMDFESNCFGCWTENLAADILVNPYPTNGTYSPLTSTTIISNTCTAAPAPATQGGITYLAHEAELYSKDQPIHGWEFEKRAVGQGFWALQRVPNTDASSNAYIRAHIYTTYSQAGINQVPQLQGASYNYECFAGALLSGQCWQTTGAAINQVAPQDVPWVEYDFTPNWGGATSIWIRAQGGAANWALEWKGKAPGNNTVASGHHAMVAYQDAIYWQVNTGNVQGGPDNLPNNRSYNNLQPSDRQAAEILNWRWLKLGAVTVPANQLATLKLYMGSTGVVVDKIIFTSESSGSIGNTVNDTGGQSAGGSASLNLRNLFTQNGGQGPAATAGSATREACNVCNPVFGLSVNRSMCSCKKFPGDNTIAAYPGGGTGAGCSIVAATPITHNLLGNDLFADVAPLRNAQEAVKNFAKRLDPKFDQIGFVVFSENVENTAAKRAKLQCLRWAGNYGGADGQRKCYEPATNPITYTAVITRLENQSPGGTTNIGEGMREGLEELGIYVDTYNPAPGDGTGSSCSNGANDKHSCDRRGGARRVLILMTDGSPNEQPDNGCGNNPKWRGVEGANVSFYNCAIWYANLAATNNVTVYTIGIGAGANRSLLEAMAKGTDPAPAAGDDGFYFADKGGKYYPAVQPSDLDAIFTDILGNVFVRIIG